MACTAEWNGVEYSGSGIVCNCRVEVELVQELTLFERVLVTRYYSVYSYRSGRKGRLLGESVQVVE